MAANMPRLTFSEQISSKRKSTVLPLVPINIPGFTLTAFTFILEPFSHLTGQA